MRNNGSRLDEPSGSGSSSSSSNGGKRRGKCKWFNVAKGWGFVTPDDGGPDVFVHQSVIRMNGFRSLAEGEQVEFETTTSDKGLEATIVTGVGGNECTGSQRRPAPTTTKRKIRRIRCYNCGEFASHIASKCTKGPLPKRCHHCKSDAHLIADCPTRPDRRNELQNTPEEQRDNQPAHT